MKKPIVGITPQIDYEQSRHWIRPGYPAAMIDNGIIPVVFPVTDNREDLKQLLSGLDGVILSGGFDVAPHLYGEETLPCCRTISPERDTQEFILVEELRAANIPTIGICRGIQVINTALGGTLYQDIKEQYGTDVVHGAGPLFEIFRHTVTLTDGTPIREAVGEETISVNSCHHQAIKDLAPCLKTCAVSEDGLVEAVYDPDLDFFMGVQWHPEGSYSIDENSRKVLGMFARAVHAAAKKKEGK